LLIHLLITAVAHGLIGTGTRAFSRFGHAQSAGNNDVEGSFDYFLKWFWSVASVAASGANEMDGNSLCE